MIREFEAEALGYLIGNNDEICEPSISEIKNVPTLLKAFKAGWRTGKADLAKGERNACKLE